MTTKARLGADRAALKESADALLRGRAVTVASPLRGAVLSALHTIGCEPAVAHKDTEGRVWLGDWYAKEECSEEVWVRRRGGNPYMVRPSRKRAASALVREWVRERLDAWVQDEGGGE